MSVRGNLVNEVVKVKGNLRRNWVGVAATVVAFAVILFWLDATTAIVISLLALSLMARIDARVPVAAGIIILPFSAAMLMAQHRSCAESLAAWSFYLLLIGIAVRFAELRREIRGRGEGEDEGDIGNARDDTEGAFKSE